MFLKKKTKQTKQKTTSEAFGLLCLLAKVVACLVFSVTRPQAGFFALGASSTTALRETREARDWRKLGE